MYELKRSQLKKEMIQDAQKVNPIRMDLRIQLRKSKGLDKLLGLFRLFH